MIFRRARGAGYRSLRRKKADQHEGRAHASSTDEWIKATTHKIGFRLHSNANGACPAFAKGASLQNCS